MKKAMVLGLLAVCMACMTCLSVPRAALAMGPDVEAGSAVLIDMQSRRVLASQNAHERLPMASTTKVMTALVAVENCSLDEIVTVGAEAYGITGSSMYLNLGEKLALEDLLYGLMLVSGNDAAVAIAVHVGGSVEGFIQMMNNRAAELGCVNTHFVTPNGLHDEEHYTSAYDLALISAQAMQNDTFREIVGTQYWTCTSGDIARTLKNKNKLLWNYPGGNGIKTGYTKDAGKCLAFSAEQDGNTLIGIVLNCPDMWNSATTLLNAGFENHTWEPVVNAGEVMAEIQVAHGMKNNLEVVSKESILIPLRKGEGTGAVELRMNCPGKLEAPVFVGQVVGSVEAWADGRLLKSVPLIAKQTVMRKELAYYIGRIIRDFSA